MGSGCTCAHKRRVRSTMLRALLWPMKMPSALRRSALETPDGCAQWLKSLETRKRPKVAVIRRVIHVAAVPSVGMAVDAAKTKLVVKAKLSLLCIVKMRVKTSVKTPVSLTKRYVKWVTLLATRVSKAEEDEAVLHSRRVNPRWATTLAKRAPNQCSKDAGIAAAWSITGVNAPSQEVISPGVREMGEAAGQPSRLPALGTPAAERSADTAGPWGGSKSQLYKVFVTAHWNYRTWKCQCCYDKHGGSAC